MKKIILFIALVLVATFSFAQNQQPHKPPPMADRWKHDSTTLVSSINLSADQLKKTKSAFYSFYKEMDALKEKNKGTRPPREEVEKLVTKRDDAVKAVLNKDQATKYEAMKKQFMPPPPPPPGNSQQKQPPPSKK